MIVGNQNDGLDDYIEHYANKQVKKGRKVNVVEAGTDEHWLLTTAKNINEKVVDVIKGDKADTDWIIISRNGATVSV